MSEDNAARQFRSPTDTDIDFLFRASPLPQAAWRERSEPAALCDAWGGWECRGGMCPFSVFTTPTTAMNSRLQWQTT